MQQGGGGSETKFSMTRWCGFGAQGGEDMCTLGQVEIIV